MLAVLRIISGSSSYRGKCSLLLLLRNSVPIERIRSGKLLHLQQCIIVHTIWYSQIRMHDLTSTGPSCSEVILGMNCSRRTRKIRAFSRRSMFPQTRRPLTTAFNCLRLILPSTRIAQRLPAIPPVRLAPFPPREVLRLGRMSAISVIPAILRRSLR